MIWTSANLVLLLMKMARLELVLLQTLTSCKNNPTTKKDWEWPSSVGLQAKPRHEQNVHGVRRTEPLAKLLEQNTEFGNREGLGASDGRTDQVTGNSTANIPSSVLLFITRIFKKNPG